MFVAIGDTTWKAEVADTPDTRAQGLAGRDSLLELTGMLFVFESRRTVGFWMRGMRFPLDFVWITDGCEVAQITRDAQPVATSTPPGGVLIYESEVPTAYTFEINAGEADAHGVTVGDRVRFRGIPLPSGAVC